ncbi:4-diphosphocytidyl-2-C-methyl-D-erythritol kinase [Frankia casuarinae]|uniref:4-diphosphocytidyl-2-C-methyl-D-erythritol kinase n=1 Tax=Frankia casuarinae (strain DSM 45818 / CECT 9043 / HFP020203 / CcI3) TaxID=106370 RepID=Q2J5Y4_FRACC|nr:4-(cytidine 5'-diphospho)-2-C-methyl-D-erythritol kinase [Frankia casuarinae]ABD13308.1 4-diphosphocytidyl-2-C-methyl-D-erythritol kinase [Frankia casuarinae]EYT93830.1 4-diphosphocytidyl-2-C-methyl-D-erythritol kinase [Frankia casuarinae]
MRAPAKVNLHLGVGPLRPDGYHDVITVLQAVSLFDDVSATSVDPPRFHDPGPSTTDGNGGSDGNGRSSGDIVVTVEVSGEGADPASLGPATSTPEVSIVPTGRDNIAVRAAHLVAEAAGITSERVHLTLTKGIPVAAGMAGGSADAAAALVACDALWQTGLDRATLTRLAAQLGSDVPFPLAGGTALGTGRGEQLTDVLATGEYYWVFALADGGLSTPAVYKEFDRLTEGKLRTGPTPADDVLAALRTGDPGQLGAALVNDLQPAALRLRPSLRRVLEAGRELGAVGAIVSGSGPTCAFLTAGAQESIALAASLAGMGVARAVRRASGPASGARMVEGAGEAP